MPFCRENLYSACDLGTDLEDIKKEFPETDVSFLENV